MLVNFESLSYDTKSMQELPAEIGSKKISLYHLSQFSHHGKTHVFSPIELGRY